MAGREELCDYSMDSVRSPIKPALTSAARSVESVHTSDEEVAGIQLKGEYELARDKRVAEYNRCLSRCRRQQELCKSPHSYLSSGKVVDE